MAALREICDRDLRRSVIAGAENAAVQPSLFFPDQSPVSPTEGEFMARFLKHPEFGVETSVEKALQSCGASLVREMRATMVADKSVADISSVTCALYNAFNEAAPVVAKSFCEGSPSGSISQRVSLDEDLLSPDDHSRR